MHPMRINMTEPLDKPKITKGFIFRIASYLSPYKKYMLGAIILIFVVSVLGLAPQLLLQQIIDVALGQKQFVLLVQLISLSFGSTLLLNLFSTLQDYINMTISKNITQDMKSQMYHHLQHMSVRFFSTEKSGEIMTRMTSDIDGVSDVFHSTVATLLSGVFILGTTLFTLFAMNPILALVAVATIPLFVIPTRKVGKKRWKITSVRQEKSSALNSHIQETLSISGSLLTKVFTMEDDEFDEFKNKNQEVISLQKKEQITGRWYRMTLSLLSSIGPLLVYLVGGYLYIKGQMTVGSILTFAGLLSRLYQPVMQLSNLHIDTVNSLALFQRIFQYLDLPHEIVDSSDATDQSVSGKDIHFNHVSFAYGDDKQALKNVSFTAPYGKVTALVGSSGAGKTTITNLLPRFYDIDSGEIKIGDINLDGFTITSLRNQIGVVTQEPYLFNGTIRDNLLYGAENATENQMISAAKAAYIHDFIVTMPNGYDTVVGNRGVKLSGGEKQRISIARVILKNPPILILDEATSALDSVSEAYVQKAMEPLLKNRTALVIAHRLSTIQNAQQILVVSDGTIVERGSHYELLAKNGIYTQMYNRQFKDNDISA